MNVKFIAIAALGKNREIGLNGDLPWSLPDEYEHFKKTIKGHYVLIGRNNFQSHSGDVEGAKPIVLTHDPEASFPNAVVVNDMNQVVDFADQNAIKEVYVIGGAEVYNLTLPYLSEFYCSIVDYEGPADKYFPEYMFYEWEISDQRIHKNWTMYHMKKHPDF